MTRYFSYIGALDGDNNNGNQKFHWEPPDEIYRVYNLPRRLIPAEAYADLPVSVFYLMRLIEEKRHEGRQIDWGAWALKMTGAQLRDFFAQESYQQSLDESVIKAIAALDADQFYALVVGEHA
jgi:hypothetical protein